MAVRTQKPEETVRIVRPRPVFRVFRPLIVLVIAGGLAPRGAAAEDRVTLPILDAVTLTSSCNDALRRSRAAVADMERLPLAKVSVETVLDRWDKDAIAVEDVIGPVAILNNVHPDKAVRDAADACILEYSSFTTEVFQNEKLYARVRAVKPRSDVEKQLQKDLIENFEDSGVTLVPAKRKRFKEISDELTALSQEFERNVRDNSTKLTFTAEEARGLPEEYLARVKAADGSIQIGFDSPDYVPFMTNAENEAARKRYYVAYQTRGGKRNLEILDKMVALRKELASLYGLPSYAHYVTKRRMVENPETVNKFLEEVSRAVTEAETRDLEELRRLKAETTGQPLEQTRINRWDVSFYSEKLRERKFQIDQEALRKYFPARQSVEWLLDVASKLYGVKFEKAWVPTWHSDVEYYDVTDTASGKRLSGFYLDLYPREGKYKHAAAWPVRGVSLKAGRTPISVLVCNLDRKGLTRDELETLFHEFGHGLHGVLSQTQYNLHSGTSVEGDFVEAPSAIFEEWTRRYESLKTLSARCGDCPPIDKALVDRLNASRRFGQGMAYARQHLYSAYDMSLSGEKPGKVLEVWKQMEGATPLGYVEGTEFPGSFAHIAGGYAAGYYGYMWAEVIALDMVSMYGDDLMNPEVGRRFREAILARGGEEPAKQLVQKFLGRPVRSDAFFAEISGRRN